jgi:hypothetical protein
MTGQSRPNPADHPPTERVVEILKRELPGFASSFDAGTDTFRVKGHITFGTSAVLDPVYAVPVDEYGEASERFAAELIRMTRRNGIEALGIEKLIVEREKRARDQGKAEGFKLGEARGRDIGYHDGRAAAIHDIAVLFGLES